VAQVFSNFVPPQQWHHQGEAWPTAKITADKLSSLPILSIVAGTDGSSPTIERARTVLAAAYPRERFASTEAEWQADSAQTLTGWKQLANVVIVASLAIAGCSLAASVIGGLSDRKRPFSMLRLTGVPLGMLRNVVALETAVPLLLAAVVAIAIGFLAAQLFLTAQMQYSLSSPGVAYYVIVVAGLAASLGIVASTLPLLRRMTGPETARNE
jgi:predicted lysophospholipase L1 biosynthesis ABC-type transport system permease subunit